MIVTNAKVYDLAEAIVASGYPMLAHYEPNDVASIVACVKEYIDTGMKCYEEISKPHIDRAVKLASAKDGSGHKTFMSGILVSMDVTASNAWWLQFGRYHFAQIVSSQSKMHRLKQLAEDNAATELLSYSDYDRLQDRLQRFKDGDIDEIELIYACPMGLQLTARVTTNYLQLRTIYNQRKNHKLAEWHRFCGWIETLPMAKQLITLEA
jgi:hypothetical protein